MLYHKSLFCQALFVGFLQKGPAPALFSRSSLSAGPLPGPDPPDTRCPSAAKSGSITQKGCRTVTAQITPIALPGGPTPPPVPAGTLWPPPGFLHPFNRAVNQLNDGHGLADGEARLLELLLSYDLPDPATGGTARASSGPAAPPWPSPSISPTAPCASDSPNCAMLASSKT